MAMCLFYDDDYEEVMRKLVGSLQEMDSWSEDWEVPTTSAIAQARQRLTDQPLRVLFERVAAPVAGRGTKGAWLRSRRLMAVDGFMLDVADTEDNVTEFGRLDTGAKASAFPQVRVLALTECGSHASVAAAFGGCRVDERVLLPEVFGAFAPDMLVMADRNLCATRRFIAFPAQPGGIGGVSLDLMAYPVSKEDRGPEHARKPVVAPRRMGRRAGEVRTIWLKLDCLNPNLQWRQGPARRKAVCNRRRIRAPE